MGPIVVASSELAVPVVLVHGAMHGGWCWERVVPLLRELGHPVMAVDLRGSDRRVGPADVTLEAYTQDVVSALQAMPEPSLLVGHSMGGLPISTAAESRPDLVRVLVYLCAAVPVSGQALIEGSANTAAREQFRSDDGGLSYYFEPDYARDIFYGDCPPTETANAMSRITPQPARPLREVVRLSSDRYGAVPKHYIITTRDAAINPQIQAGYAASLDTATILRMNSGHSPFYSQPRELATVLSEIGRNSRRSC